MGVALAPDLDLLLRFVDGRPHHQGMVHSVGFAAMAGLITYGVGLAARSKRALQTAIAVFLAYGSHVFLDYFSSDTHPPIGLRALWPFHDGFFKFPYPVFLDIGRDVDWTTILNNARAGLWEVVLLAPVTWLAWRLATRREA